MEKGTSPTAPLVPPDGGYGWIIVLSALLQMSCAFPIIPMFGLIFGSKFDEFDTSPTEKTSIFGVYLLTWNIITLFVGPLSSFRVKDLLGFAAQLWLSSGWSFVHFLLALLV